MTQQDHIQSLVPSAQWEICDRRGFLRHITMGAGGLAAAGSFGLAGCSSRPHFTGGFNQPAATIPDTTSVSLVTGTDRRNMVAEALRPFEEHLKQAIGEKQVVIKVNCVREGYPLIATPPDTVRGILDVLGKFYDRRVIIGESTASPLGTMGVFEDYGFTELPGEYNVKLVELNDEPTSLHWILDQNLYPQQIQVINTFTDPNNFIISAARFKTHNRVITTLSLKNVVMGSPLKKPKQKINDKQKMHAGHTTAKMINFNMFLMAHRVRPHFSVLDGVEGMEGNGPSNGEPVDHRVMVAGPDFLAVDRIGSELMGVPFEDIGVLNYCATAGLGQADPDKIRIIGPDPKNHVIKYKLHDNIDWQYNWKDELILKESL